MLRPVSRYFLTSIVTLLLSGCANQTGMQLRHDLQQQILAAGLQPDQVALVVLPVAMPGEPAANTAVIQHNADLLLQPASTLKLVTSAVALDQLGPLWRGETEFLADAADLAQARQSGILTKPLYVRGKGDPELDYAAVSSMLAQLYNEGVRELRAGVLLDRSWFSPLLPDPAAAPFDESPRARYNYIPDALGLNQHMLQLQLRSNTTSVQLTSLPVLTDLQLKSELQLTDARCDQFNPDLLLLNERTLPNGGVELVLRGDFPRNCLLQEDAAWLSRDAQWQLSLSQFWRQLGGRFGAPLRVQPGITPTDAVVVAQHFSRPLPQLLQQLNKNSDNGLARILALQLGRLAPVGADPQQPDTVQAAEQVVLHWLTQRQLPAQGLVLDNGSGLSRQARISASQLAALLQHAWQQPWGLDLASSLPRAGIDGTLQNRMRTTSALDSARLKTGTLRNGTGLAGYVFDRQRRPWVFVGLVNAEQGVAKGRPLLDLWVEKVSQF